MVTGTVEQMENRVAKIERNKRIALGITSVAAAEYAIFGLTAILGGQTIFFLPTFATVVPLFGGFLRFSFLDREEEVARKDLALRKAPEK